MAKHVYRLRVVLTDEDIREAEKRFSGHPISVQGMRGFLQNILEAEVRGWYIENRERPWIPGT
jgi:hypothetical protein